MKHSFVIIRTCIVLAFFTVGRADASLITNGDFETGNFTGWTLFVTQFGGVQSPTVVPFDVNGDAIATNSARFDVGQIGGPCGIGAPCPAQGGGIFQDFASGAGQLVIGLDIAAQSDGNNGAGGLFTLFLDGTEIDAFDFGDIFAGTIERAHLGGSRTVTAGVHELRIQVARNGGIVSSLPGLHEYVDDIGVSGPEPGVIPEPATLLLLGTGLAAAAKRYRSQRSSH